MNIIYEDEYGVDMYSTNSDVVPRIGESILFQDEYYRIKSVTWDIERHSVVISVTQNTVKEPADDGTDRRLSEVKNAIIKTNKRLDAQEKKSGALDEKFTSMRTFIKSQRTPNDTKQ